MKFILSSIVKICIIFLILLVPVDIIIAVFTIAHSDIPLWNIGIRSIFMVGITKYITAILISYITATLVTVALVDKMKVRSLFMLHLAPLLVCILLISVICLVESKKGPLILHEKNITVGYKTFLREGIFKKVQNHVTAQSPVEIY